MRKRNLIFLGITVLAALGILAYVGAQPADKIPTYYAAAKRTAVVSKCVAADSSISISAGERNSVEMAAISYLIDVPAGTNVDVLLQSYSKDKVVGSDRYPDKFGNYNFVLTKQNGDWIVTQFTRCN